MKTMYLLLSGQYVSSYILFKSSLSKQGHRLEERRKFSSLLSTDSQTLINGYQLTVQICSYHLNNGRSIEYFYTCILFKTSYQWAVVTIWTTSILKAHLYVYKHIVNNQLPILRVYISIFSSAALIHRLDYSRTTTQVLKMNDQTWFESHLQIQATKQSVASL